MNRLKGFALHIVKGMYNAAARFPLTVASLVGAAVLVCYTIYKDTMPELIIQKLIFTFIVGAALGMAAQFACERFKAAMARRLPVAGASALLTAGYLMILWPAPEISMEMGVRTFVAVFALICAVLWLPAYKDKTDFNKLALTHFKSAFTSLLYSGVLSGGLAAIIAAVDILLFNVDNDTYGYMMTIVWILFAPIYYLSLLPLFSSDDEEEMQRTEAAAACPRFLAILVSYIAIPLLSAYTAVLVAYFIKILVTRDWPSGQLGVLVLAYSAAGLVIFVLSSILDNKFAYWYRMLFPKIWIPIVVMQIVSVVIRLNAYGVTESRYYVLLFGVFSIACGVLLSLRPVSRNACIAMLAAGFAIISVVPPVDAFTVSRTSQIDRLESILEAEGILAGGVLTPDTDAAFQTKTETTNILSYLEGRSSLRYVAWLPDDFNMYEDMKAVFGFEPTYPGYGGDLNTYYYASIDGLEPIIITGFDAYVNIYSDRWNKDGSGGASDHRLQIGQETYTLAVTRLDAEEVLLEVKDATGTVLVATSLYAFAEELRTDAVEPKEPLPVQDMTLDVSKNGYRLRVIFQNISMTIGTGDDAGVDYGMQVFFGLPE